MSKCLIIRKSYVFGKQHISGEANWLPLNRAVQSFWTLRAMAARLRLALRSALIAHGEGDALYDWDCAAGNSSSALIGL